MSERSEHCAFEQLNLSGRCIATCYLAKDDTDCTGAEGPTMNLKDGGEVQLTGRGGRDHAKK